jgi:hypothetical protein
MFLLRLRPFLPVAAVLAASLATAQEVAPTAPAPATEQAPPATAAEAREASGLRPADRASVRALRFSTGDVRMVRYTDASGAEVARYFQAQPTSDTEIALIEVEAVSAETKGEPARRADASPDSPEMMTWLMVAMGFTPLGKVLPTEGEPQAITGLDGQLYRFGPKPGTFRPQRVEDRPAGPAGEKVVGAITWHRTESGWERGPEVRSVRTPAGARDLQAPREGPRMRRPSPGKAGS